MCLKDNYIMDKSSLISALAGLSGSASGLILYPLEFLKVNIIAGDGHSKNYIPHYKNSKQAIVSIYRTKGFLNLYKGSHVTLFSSVAWSLYFYIYEKAKQRYSKIKDTHPNSYKFLVASEAAILSRILTSPLWTIKTRLILQQNSSHWYGDTTEAIKKIWRLDGPRGYFAGLFPGLLLCTNGIFNLYFYEVQKEMLKINSSYGTGLIAMNSKFLSSLITYPIQLVMIKLQQEQYSTTILKHSAEIPSKFTKEKFFSGSLNCVKKTYQNEGFRGFYRGIPLQLIRVIPGNGLFFVLYEFTINLFKETE
jgi:solute carrier family 25 (mitochondrial folate transporter), member 32